eukprot:16279961-Heterocapsa_arctica.AAC.1
MVASSDNRILAQDAEYTVVGRAGSSISTDGFQACLEDSMLAFLEAVGGGGGAKLFHRSPAFVIF